MSHAPQRLYRLLVPAGAIALVVAAVVYCAYFSRLKPPMALSSAVERLLQARLQGDCPTLWSLASVSFREQHDEGRFCFEHQRKCAQGSMEYELASVTAGRSLIGATIQCGDGTVTPVATRWLREGNAWVFDELAEGL